MKKLLIIILLLPGWLSSQTEGEFYIDGGLIFSHFQQQVKQEVGDPRGERLINQTEFGLLLSGRYLFNNFIAAGVFLRTDFGKKEAALFDGFDSDGKTVVKNKLGGNYTEIWFGPQLTFIYKQLFAEVGYGLVGIRSDDGRNDLPSNTGDISGSFKTSPSIAWLVAIGGVIPVIDKLNLLIKVEYRIRYYDERGGNPLINNVDHGTQSISPLIGISWNP